MKSKLAILILVLIVVSCQFKAGNFRRMDKEAPQGLTELGGQVSGENCAYFFPMAGQPNIEEATYDALGRAPAGATGLKDVTIESNFMPIFISKLCYKVTGTPVKE